MADIINFEKKEDKVDLVQEKINKLEFLQNDTTPQEIAEMDYFDILEIAAEY